MSAPRRQGRIDDICAVIRSYNDWWSGIWSKVAPSPHQQCKERVSLEGWRRSRPWVWEAFEYRMLYKKEDTLAKQRKESLFSFSELPAPRQPLITPGRHPVVKRNVFLHVIRSTVLRIQRTIIVSVTLFTTAVDNTSTYRTWGNRESSESV